jgi:hypothetical protein
MKRPPARRKAALAALGLLVATALAGCGDSATEPPPAAGSVTLQFRHTVGGENLLFGSKIYINAAGNLYEVRNLRYYVSDAVLHATDGTEHRVDAVHYVDAAVAGTQTWALGDVPDGRYDEIRFVFGLRPDRNWFGSLPSTQENLNMNWPAVLGGGYHFMQLDGRYAAPGNDDASWQTHLGRLQRSTDPQPYDHHFEVRLPLAAFEVAGQAWNAEVVMDVNGWYASPHVYDFDVFGSYVMENPTAQQYLMENGPHAFAVGAVTAATP